MKQSKWDKRKLGHYRPVKDCKIPEQTFGEICHECNKCGRFNSIARRKRKVKKEYGIYYSMPKASYSVWREWRHWQNYTTEKRRDQALKVLQSKAKYFEFRKNKPS
jgi:hypothetical protein